MKLHKYILFLFLNLLAFGYGQEKDLAEADKNFNAFSFVDAQKIYLKVAEDGFRSQDLFQKLGDSYYFTSNLAAATKWYEKLIKHYRKDVKPEYFFRFSQCLKSWDRYNEADKMMATFKNINKNDRRAGLFGKKRDYLKFIERQSGRFEIKQLDINSKFSEFAPAYYNGDLVFASSRDKGINKPVHEWNEMPFLDLYRYSKNTATGVQKIKKITGAINTKYHESSSTFSKDGLTMYFTRNNFTDHKLKTDYTGTTLLKIYRAHYVNGKWEEVEELSFNSDDYSIAHPALSMDGKKLYFSSDMPGGYGLSDLYEVTINLDGTFGEPKNLGNRINTEGRETFPFISDRGKLYFSSDGHVGLGGLDVFIARPYRGGFAPPFNLGRPINSQEDDFSFITNEEDNTGYLSSNRSGGVGDDDLYGFIQIEDVISQCEQYVHGVLTDEFTKRPLANAEVVLYDGNLNELEKSKTDAKGMYKFQLDCWSDYIVRGSSADYSSTEFLISTSNLFEYEYVKPITLKRGDRLGRTKVTIGDDLNKLLQLEPIYFDFGSSEIRPDAGIELQKLIAALNQNPSLKIDVRSHTDSRSDDQSNLRMSELRAKSTVDYLVASGSITPDRITWKGYGETQLINECANGVKCSESKHGLNRRSEFIIFE